MIVGAYRTDVYTHMNVTTVPTNSPSAIHTAHPVSNLQLRAHKTMEPVQDNAMKMASKFRSGPPHSKQMVAMHEAVTPHKIMLPRCWRRAM